MTLAKSVPTVSIKSFRLLRRTGANRVTAALQLWTLKQHVASVLLERLKLFKMYTQQQREYIITCISIFFFVF
jgi:hypothetical protein